MRSEWNRRVRHDSTAISSDRLLLSERGPWPRPIGVCVIRKGDVQQRKQVVAIKKMKMEEPEG